MSHIPTVLVACEYSGWVRDAFKKAGCIAFSCDLLQSDTPGHHYQGDVTPFLDKYWDLIIAHPPCTYLCNSGAKHLYNGMSKANGINQDRWDKMEAGSRFMKTIMDADCPRIAVENPIMMGHAKEIIGRGQDQIIQPWQFGHGEIKATCLWLKGLPKLQPTNIVDGREAKVHKMGPSPDRWKKRSTTYQGVADAMAAQWAPLLFSVLDN